MSRAKKGKLMKWVFIIGALLIGAYKASEIKEMVQKVPFIANLMDKVSGNA